LQGRSAALLWGSGRLNSCSGGSGKICPHRRYEVAGGTGKEEQQGGGAAANGLKQKTRRQSAPKAAIMMMA